MNKPENKQKVGLDTNFANDQEAKNDSYKDFVKYLNNEILVFKNRMEILKHLTIGLALGAILSILMGMIIYIPLVLISAGLISYVLFKRTSKQINSSTLYRDCTIAEIQ